MADITPFKRLILRAVLQHVSLMVICLISVSDQMPLPELHEVFRAILGWNGPSVPTLMRQLSRS